LPEELQKDPVTRGEFLFMGTVGTLVGAVMTIPPIVYILDPVIKSEFLGQSNIPDEWVELGSVFEIPAHEPKTYRVEFPQNQSYALEKEKIKEPGKEGSLIEAVLVTWREGEIPSILENRGEGPLSTSEIEELTPNLNVVSNHCTHLGCPVRWIEDKGEILCPCHGGIYNINGATIGGPPPRGLYRYTFEIRDDGGIYVKHEFDGNPYVI
jgi:Rieske Fe-S protein